MDDSGTRHPDHKPKKAEHKNDWFALGGILIDDENIKTAEAMIDAFRSSWQQLGDSPLHSCEVRGCHENFAWLGKDEEIRRSFLTELEQLLFKLPVVGLACVIDRPGYNSRYVEKYGRERWMLCKTAFAIAVERAVKYSIARERRMRVYVERCSKADDDVMHGYYKDLKTNGHCFNPDTAAKYAPSNPIDYQSTLYEFRTKAKSSRLMQIADLFLWPICMGGYDAKNYAYSRLLKAGKLIECFIPEESIQQLGSKYSCFDHKGQKT